MKKRFGKQFLCYLLSVTLFASVLQVPVGALQVSPQDGTKQSVENKTDSSEITSDTISVRKEEKTLDFALNGGSLLRAISHLLLILQISCLMDRSSVSRGMHLQAGTIIKNSAERLLQR